MAHEHEHREHKPKAGQLPPLAVGTAEINRLLRELAAIDNTLLEHTLRRKDGETEELRTSRLMDQLIEVNELNLLHKEERDRLRRFLETVNDRAPVLHMSFSADPTPAFLEKLVVWLRENIHPQALVTIGVQPTIAAGCIVRTTNKYFDFSLRQDFAGKRGLLLERLAAAQAQETQASQAGGR
ncbi:MAG TPA: hypothetical protein VHA05_03150 [Candidatus Saccharimonadales bacterium]|nr:hypothetical protein [Candidatus Saccharimonadales bacterium]